MCQVEIKISIKFNESQKDGLKKYELLRYFEQKQKILAKMERFKHTRVSRMLH
jgi:hypothetical protein